VPAAAVIPAPIAYIKIVAVETSVVEFHSQQGSQPYGSGALYGAGTCECLFLTLL
jgi:hypothetical protein